MAIPFFRKGKDKSLDALAKRLAKEAPASPTQGLETLWPGAGGIVVEEASGASSSVIDEAAILYANNQNDAVESALKTALMSDDPRGWHMLFDLYRLQNREKDFEQIALQYATRFETSPPVWGILAPAIEAVEQDAASSLSLPPFLDMKACASLRSDLTAAARHATILLDFSRIEMVDEAGASECTRILAGARKLQCKLKVSGVDRLIRLLQDLNRATRSRPAHWLLLLELYQLLGRQNEFEDLAVDYAVRFEVSPPSWVEPTVVEVVHAPMPEPTDDALTLSGEITPRNETAFQQMARFAATRSEILIDLSQVTRVDYASVSSLIGLLMQWLGEGKTVTLRNQHTLINELFRVMGIDQLAQLQPARLV